MTTQRLLIATRTRVLRTAGALAVLVGSVLGALLAWQLWWTDVRAAERSDDMVAELRAGFDHLDAGPVAQLSTTASTTDPSRRADAPDATHTGSIVHLPTIGEVHPVLPGIDADVLDLGVLGRYPGSADPGETGNFAVAGHRTTYGRPLWALDELAPGDPVVVETAEAYHVYILRGQRVVSPQDTSVLAPTPDRPGEPPTEASMVLTTCHPVFSARQRLVGYAVLDRSVPRAEGPPPELATTTS